MKKTKYCLMGILIIMSIFAFSGCGKSNPLVKKLSDGTLLNEDIQQRDNYQYIEDEAFLQAVANKLKEYKENDDINSALTLIAVLGEDVFMGNSGKWEKTLLMSKDYYDWIFDHISNDDFENPSLTHGYYENEDSIITEEYEDSSGFHHIDGIDYYGDFKVEYKDRYNYAFITFQRRSQKENCLIGTAWDVYYKDVYIFSYENGNETGMQIGYQKIDELERFFSDAIYFENAIYHVDSTEEYSPALIIYANGDQTYIRRGTNDRGKTHIVIE